MPEILPAILACARRRVAVQRARVPQADLVARASLARPRARLFEERLGRADSINVIAECKRRSPSKGVLQRDYQPEDLARDYAEGGAAAVSVLTEPCFFDGTLDHLARVRAVVDVPVLRKDFIVDEYQIHEARAAGADAVLLIVAALPGKELDRLLTAAHAAGLAALVEVHDRRELERALASGARIVGVNARDLRTLTLQGDMLADMAEHLVGRAVAVAESGMASVDDVLRLRARGYQAFLIGEWLMTAPDPRQRLRQLLGGASS
jgi:indole-3-glycerol phosphate synthase